MLAQTQLPVSCFRFPKVFSADQIMGVHEFMVDHLLNTLQGQNWVMHWNPAQDFTECQILFPFIPDRVTHIRPIANYFQQHLMDPSIMYRPRHEFIEHVRAFDVNRCLEHGGWGLTTMTRLNNLFGKAITETRTKIMSPTEVTYKYITREIPMLGQSLVSPLAGGLGHNMLGHNMLGHGMLSQGMLGDHMLSQDMLASEMLGTNMAGGHMLGNMLGRNMLNMHNMHGGNTMIIEDCAPHTMRGLANLLNHNLVGSLNYSPIGLTAPMGLALDRSPLSVWKHTRGLGLRPMAMDMMASSAPVEVVQKQVEQVDIQREVGLGVQQQGLQGMGYAQHIPLGGRTIIQSLNPMNAMNSMAATLNPASMVVQGLNHAVCQTLNPAVCEQQQQTAATVKVAQVSPAGGMGMSMGMGMGSPLSPMHQMPLLKKVVC